MACQARISVLSESKKDKNFFDYKDLSSDMWHKKIKETQDKHKVHFDLENDYDIAQREIDIPQDEWEHFKYVKFRCELYSAGGDWEDPVFYFRCQLKDGYARDLHEGDHFIYIPCQAEGNTNLVQGKNGEWHAATDEDRQHNGKQKGSEYKAWQGLKKYLTKLVKDEIASVRKERRDRGDQPGESA